MRVVWILARRTRANAKGFAIVSGHHATYNLLFDSGASASDADAGLFGADLTMLESAIREHEHWLSKPQCFIHNRKCVLQSAKNVFIRRQRVFDRMTALLEAATACNEDRKDVLE